MSPLIYGMESDVNYYTCFKSCWNSLGLEAPETCRYTPENSCRRAWIKFCRLCDKRFPNMYTNCYKEWGNRPNPPPLPEGINFEVGGSSTQDGSNWEDTSHITRQLETVILDGKYYYKNK